MFAKYLEEQENLETIKTNYGFISFRCRGEECFVGHLFVEEGKRHLKNVLKLRDMMVVNALARGCKFITCNAFFEKHNKEISNKIVKVYMYMGFEIEQVFDKQILLVKNIEEV